MNSGKLVIVLIVILIVFYIINGENEEGFKNVLDYLNYNTVNYNTRMVDGIETVIPSSKNVCKQVNMNNDNVRERYLAKDVKFNQTVPKPNYTQNLNEMIDNNSNNIKVIDNNQYDDVDIKSLNSMMADDDYNSIDEVEELLTIN